MWQTGVQSLPGSGRPPEEENGYPLQYSCLQNSMDRGAWKGTEHGVTKSHTGTHTHTHTHTHSTYNDLVASIQMETFVSKDASLQMVLHKAKTKIYVVSSSQRGQTIFFKCLNVNTEGHCLFSRHWLWPKKVAGYFKA